MKKSLAVVDYRQLRPGNLNSEEFSHLKLLLYWPVYGLLFLFVERFYQVDSYYAVHCALDDYIPFNELFLIPYMFWFLFLIGMHLYTLLYDTRAFRQMMKFIIISYSVTIIIYFIFPTCQLLRPESFARDNVLTRFMAGFYRFDTNTNVCPSIHVIGSLAVMFTAWHCRGLEHWGWKLAFTVTAVLISISTVFLKQHSALDILAAVPVSLIAYRLAFRSREKGLAVMPKSAESPAR